jgi:uncharacterized protein (DUF2147 family)
MKKLLFTAIIALFIPLFLSAQSTKIEGIWFNEEKTSKIDVTTGSDGQISGEIVWLEEPNEFGATKLDKENPDAELAKKPVMGLVIVKGFTYNTDKERWTGASIYDPKNGKTYDCYAWFEDGNYNNLYIKGYVAGIKALGRKTLWTKTKL